MELRLDGFGGDIANFEQYGFKALTHVQVVRPPRERGAEGLCQGVASSHSGHLRGLGAPNQQPGRILIPGSVAGDQEAQNRPVYAMPAACPVSTDFLALWSQAYMSSCNPQVTSTSIQARLAFLAVTHRYKRTHCLWLEQFQIADSVLEHCQVQPSRTAPISTIPVHQSDQFGNGWPRASGQGFARRKERFYRPLLLFPPHSS